eukprot:3636515-Amphidinium_carterae.1
MVGAQFSFQSTRNNISRPRPSCKLVSDRSLRTTNSSVWSTEGKASTITLLISFPKYQDQGANAFQDSSRPKCIVHEARWGAGVVRSDLYI